MIQLDETDKQLLNIVQGEFPGVPQPFLHLAQQLEIPEAEDAKTPEVAAFCWEALGSAGFTRSDSIVAVGGGSSMDCAKGVNFLLTNGGHMSDYKGFGKATRPMLPSVVSRSSLPVTCSRRIDPSPERTSMSPESRDATTDPSVVCRTIFPSMASARIEPSPLLAEMLALRGTTTRSLAWGEMLTPTVRP